MVASVQQFTRLQLGIEVVGTKGTLVPATVQIIGDHTLLEEQDFYRSPYPAGVLANVGGAGTIYRKGVSIDANTELTAEEILWPLMTGVLGSVSASTSDITAKTYVFTPELTTAVKTIQSATAEMQRGDGATAHYYGEAGYCMTDRFKIDWAFNQPAKLSWHMFGRARQTGTITGAIVAYTTREILASNQLTVYKDTTWAGLGGTAVSGIVRSATFDCETGFKPDYTLAGRTDVDMTGHLPGPITAKLSIVMEFDATAATMFGQYRTNDLVYIRLKNLGSLAGAATVYRTVQIDGAYRFASAPSFSVDGDTVLMSADLDSVYDATGTKTLEFTAINKLATI